MFTPNSIKPRMSLAELLAAVVQNPFSIWNDEASDKLYFCLKCYFNSSCFLLLVNMFLNISPEKY